MNVLSDARSHAKSVWGSQTVTDPMDFKYTWLRLIALFWVLEIITLGVEILGFINFRFEDAASPPFWFAKISAGTDSDPFRAYVHVSEQVQHHSILSKAERIPLFEIRIRDNDFETGSPSVLLLSTVQKVISSIFWEYLFIDWPSFRDSGPMQHP